MKRITLVIPMTPASCLMPNKARTTHWGTKARAARDLKNTTWYCARQDSTVFKRMIVGPVSVAVTIAWERGRKRVDQDAAVVACKPILDGLTEAGVWEDDKQVTSIVVTQERDKDGVGSTSVTIRGSHGQEQS